MTTSEVADLRQELDKKNSILSSLMGVLVTKDPYVHVVQIIEFTRGCGPRNAGFLAFQNKHAADKWIDAQRQEPYVFTADLHTVYNNLEDAHCSHLFLAETLVHGNKRFCTLADLSV